MRFAVIEHVMLDGRAELFEWSAEPGQVFFVDESHDGQRRCTIYHMPFDGVPESITAIDYSSDYDYAKLSCRDGSRNKIHIGDEIL